MMRRALEGRDILVTGAAGAIGGAICARLAAAGATVLINYRTRESQAVDLKARLEAAGHRCRLVRADVTDAEQVGELFRLGPVSDIVHAASPPLREARFRKTPWTDFTSHWDVAVKGLVLLTQGALGQGAPLRTATIVLSSVTLGNPPVEKSAYVTAKFAALGLARALAVELAAKGVRVNSVSPGFTPTELTANVDPRIQELIARAVPLQRLCTPDDVAGAVAFLVGPDAEYLSGVNLPVAGGLGVQ
jgi:3-oxoacyl-[acyl-carrier protein] reductase